MSFLTLLMISSPQSKQVILFPWLLFTVNFISLNFFDPVPTSCMPVISSIYPTTSLKKLFKKSNARLKKIN